MKWTVRNYPRPMRKLAEEVRQKAIEMANILHEEQGFHEGAAVDLAISRAEMWAERYAKELHTNPGPARPRRTPEAPRRSSTLHRPEPRGPRAPTNTRPPLAPNGPSRGSAT